MRQPAICRRAGAIHAATGILRLAALAQDQRRKSLSSDQLHCERWHAPASWNTWTIFAATPRSGLRSARGYRVQRWSYGDVLGNAYRFARELEERGIGKGDKVLIWGENCAEWVVAFFGCLLRGAIVVPIDKIAAPDFAQRVAQQVDAKSVCWLDAEPRPGRRRDQSGNTAREAWRRTPISLSLRHR